MKTSLYRWFWFIAGIIVNSFGIAFITKASLGTSPISSVPYVLSFQIPFSFGQVSFLVNMLFILGQIILLKSKFKPVQFLQIAVNVLFSACIDWSMAFLSWLNPDSPVTCFLSLLTGCVILALGISIEVAPQVLYVPGEGIVNAIRYSDCHCGDSVPSFFLPAPGTGNRHADFRSSGRENYRIFP